MPALPFSLSLLAGLLLVQGWLLIGNAQYSYDRERHLFIAATPWWHGSWVPGAVDTTNAFPVMLRMTGLLGILCAITDLAREKGWRTRLFGTVMGGGMALVLYGIVQRVLRIPLFLWNETDLDHNLFASFYYHGNAGAFINLLVPGLVGLTLLEFQKPNTHARRAMMVVCLTLTLAASVAVASKAAMLVTALLLIWSGCVYFPALTDPRRLRSQGWWAKLGGAIAFAIVCIPLLGFDRASGRWSEMAKTIHGENPRLLAWRACLRMLPDAGPWGIGPGNFQIAFPHYTAGLGDRIAGVWEHAHEDYLQTCIEWGWWGFTVWGLLFAMVFRRPNHSSSVHPRNLEIDEVIRISSRMALGGLLLHALVDFPFQIPVIELYAVAFVGILWSDASRGLQLSDAQSIERDA